MGQAIAELAGTPQGAHLALILALSAALLHAIFGALQKGGSDPWNARAAMDLSYALLAMPAALFLVPWPTPRLWGVLAGAMAIHLIYKFAQGMTYHYGAYTVVYPILRGTAPLFTVAAATVVFGERYSALQWVGVLVLVAGILGLALYNWRSLTVGRESLARALGWALATGGMVAAYTTYDAWGIRQAADPLTFLAWFFALDGIALPLLLRRRLAAVPRGERAALARRGLTGAVVAICSFGTIMIATRIDAVGRAAVLRETSTVFAALVGWWLLGEKVGARRLALMALIAAGAVVMELG